jgi:hypothetical protein
VNLRTVKRLCAGAVVIALAASTAGCGDVDKAVAEVNAAIDSVSTNSDAWRATLATLSSQLGDLEKDWAADVDRIALQAGNNVSDQAKCTVAFTGQYVIQQLRDEIAKLKGQPKGAVDPAVCTTAPRDALDLGDVHAGRVRTVEFDGYNMDRGEFGLAVVTSSTGAVTPVPPDDVDYNSPYVAVLNLSRFSVPDADAKFVYLARGVRYGNQSLAIIPPAPTPTPPPVVNFGPLEITYRTEDDDRDHDTSVTAEVDAFSGQRLASYGMTGVGFPDHSTWGPVALQPSTLDLTTLTDATLRICIAPVGNDTWRFDYTLTGRYHGGPLDGQQATFGGNGESLSEDVHCLGKTMFRPPAVARAAPKQPTLRIRPRAGARGGVARPSGGGS